MCLCVCVWTGFAEVQREGESQMHSHSPSQQAVLSARSLAASAYALPSSHSALLHLTLVLFYVQHPFWYLYACV